MVTQSKGSICSILATGSRLNTYSADLPSFVMSSHEQGRGAEIAHPPPPEMTCGFLK